MLSVSHIRIRKASGPGYWISSLSVNNECGDPIFRCYVLEDAKKCPKDGEYDLKLEWSPKFARDLYELYEDGRTEEKKYHIGNTLADTNGCPLLGLAFKGASVSGSAAALKAFMKAMKGVKETKVTITTQ